jgi:sugar-specific transcriptional regulator TrmB
MKKYTSILSKIGIPEKAVEIYLELLEHGRSSPSEIVTRTGLHRPEVYRFLPSLLEMWLITKTKTGKRQFFTASSPHVLGEVFQNFQESATHVIQDLTEKYTTAHEKPRVEYREWRQGVTAVFADIINTLKPDETFYRVTSETDVEKVNTYLPREYREKRDKKNLQRYVIMSANAAKVKKNRLDRDLVVIPPSVDDFDDNVLMTIYGNKVAYIDFNTETSITIDNALIADFQKKIFKFAYNALKK